MLMSIEERFMRDGVYDMSLDELICYKEKNFETIKYYEDNKYTKEIVESMLEFENPSSDVYYCWFCGATISMCKLIMARQDCNEKLKKKCEQDIKKLQVKVRKGLYSSQGQDLKLFKMRKKALKYLHGNKKF